jgi:hypothetical protein
LGPTTALVAVNFAPTIISSAAALDAKKCKVIFVSGEHKKDKLLAILQKSAGIDGMLPYDLDKTSRTMYDLFGVCTILALTILCNDKFAKVTSSTTMVTNAHHAMVVVDPHAKQFPSAKDDSLSEQDQRQ